MSASWKAGECTHGGGGAIGDGGGGIGQPTQREMQSSGAFRQSGFGAVVQYAHTAHVSVQ